jgi:Glycosyltransferase sugar-binding region containing DXD motif
MDSSNQIIQGLWVGSDLSLMEQLSIQSFIAHGHQYHLYVYEEVANVPAGTILKNAHSILPAERIFTYQHGAEKGSYSGFADAFRWHLLAQRGGWWADLDVICLKPFDFPTSHVIASSYEGKWGSPAINCVMKMPEQSRLANYLCQANDRHNPQDIRFTETGPLLLQKAIQQLDLHSAVVEHDIFCAISWRSVRQKIAYETPKPLPLRFKHCVKDRVRSILKPDMSLDRVRRHSYAVHL